MCKDTLRLENITPSEWENLLVRVFRRVTEHPTCAPILRDIGCIQFQLLLRDRPELSYWEEYLGDRVIPHLGIAPECTVQAATTFPVLAGTLLQQISIMEAAADEAYELAGDTAALMRCVNILPYVMVAFSEVVQSDTGILSRHP